MYYLGLKLLGNNLAFSEGHRTNLNFFASKSILSLTLMATATLHLEDALVSISFQEEGTAAFSWWYPQWLIPHRDSIC